MSKQCAAITFRCQHIVNHHCGAVGIDNALKIVFSMQNTFLYKLKRDSFFHVNKCIYSYFFYNFSIKKSILKIKISHPDSINL